MPPPGDTILTSSPALMKNEKPSNDLRDDITEMLAGNGLFPDEALTISRLVVKIVEASKAPLLIYAAPSSWCTDVMPLKIQGNAKLTSRLFMIIETLNGTNNP
jgi:hypothetical protein